MIGPLQELYALIKSVPLFTNEEGDYAEYLNDDEESGAVVVRRKNGQMIMMMPADVYDDVMKRNAK